MEYCGQTVAHVGIIKVKNPASPAGASTITTVISGDGVTGRIFIANTAPPDRLRMWTITCAVLAPRLRSHGHCATLDEAKAKFAETWRAWVGLREKDRHDLIQDRPADR
jgi:hypothetical protein